MAAPLQPFYVIKTEMPMGISESRCHFILAASVERRRSGYNNPTYTLCRLQKTQNLKFLQNLAGFWIFEFSMGISQTWYFNKYIYRINVAFVNRDTQNFQLILFWILCVLFFQNAKFGPTLHFCQNKCMKIVFWWVEKLPSFHPNSNAAFLSRQW